MEIPVPLPEVPDDRDPCVERLIRRLQGVRGIEEVHISRTDGEALLCLHYDPDLLSLQRVERLAREVGAEITRRFRHETLWIRGMDCPGMPLRNRGGPK